MLLARWHFTRTSQMRESLSSSHFTIHLPKCLENMESTNWLKGRNHCDTGAQDQSLNVPATVPSHSYLFLGKFSPTCSWSTYNLFLTWCAGHSSQVLSNIDSILTFCLHSELHREFRRPLNVVYGVRRINEVNARRARLVPGWVTIFGRVYHLGM